MDTSRFSIDKLRKMLFEAPPEVASRMIKDMKLDKRKGVQRLVRRFQCLQEKRKILLERAKKLLVEEKKLWSQGYCRVAGIDEAGRGPLAGPVVAACVILPPGVCIEGIDDSKKLTPGQREKLFDIIMEKSLAVGIGRIGPECIDDLNILNATYEAMYKAIANCEITPDFLLIDALRLEKCSIPQLSLVKGDSRSQSIAAASIVAKVTRDREMMKWHQVYPEYGFDRHKGYGTAYHINAIKKLGLSPIHRKTFCSRFI